MLPNKQSGMLTYSEKCLLHVTNHKDFRFVNSESLNFKTYCQ